MTTLDERVSTAWRSGPSELHRTAERLAAEGHAESAIYESLERLLLEVRATGADDETEDRITDVMERLTGWCHESQHIPLRRVELPTETEMGRLPWWAKVAFAARCARRVLPLFERAQPGTPEFKFRDLENFVERAELAATNAKPDASRGDTDAVVYALEARLRNDHVARAVARAVSRAIRAAEANPRIDILGIERVVWEVGESAVEAANQVGTDILPALRTDFDVLVRQSIVRKWSDDSPVTPDVFGPLWPNGTPPGWPSTSEPVQELVGRLGSNSTPGSRPEVGTVPTL
jgi:hypothetical protein